MRTYISRLLKPHTIISMSSNECKTTPHSAGRERALQISTRITKLTHLLTITLTLMMTGLSDIYAEDPIEQRRLMIERFLERDCLVAPTDVESMIKATDLSRPVQRGVLPHGTLAQMLLHSRKGNFVGNIGATPKQVGVDGGRALRLYQVFGELPALLSYTNDYVYGAPGTTAVANGVTYSLPGSVPGAGGGLQAYVQNPDQLVEVYRDPFLTDFDGKTYLDPAAPVVEPVQVRDYDLSDPIPDPIQVDTYKSQLPTTGCSRKPRRGSIPRLPPMPAAAATSRLSGYAGLAAQLYADFTVRQADYKYNDVETLINPTADAAIESVIMSATLGQFPDPRRMSVNTVYDPSRGTFTHNAAGRWTPMSWGEVYTGTFGSTIDWWTTGW